ncbi:MAG TPA: PepSY-associated TM helix domain-containing protein [Albitalea sp.]|uniref:PepSY-associated TM helix domain-containing protein n=1 Tax=Piscinibacter sp. TaxID=1903157 RepID=UPI002ED5FBAA
MSAVITESPSAIQRRHRRAALFVRWLRKTHLYVGLWGAALGLLFGVTGILLNHRAVMKMPVEKVVQRSAQLALPDPSQRRFASADEMAQWLQAELPVGDVPASRVRVEPSRRVTWGEREVQQPERWMFNWQSPRRGVNAEYIVGNRFVKLETQDATPIGTLTRLHQAAGAGVFWVLLSDTVAGAAIVLSVTGLLLWSRLHPMRLSSIAVALAALLGTVWTLWST